MTRSHCTLNVFLAVAVGCLSTGCAIFNPYKEPTDGPRARVRVDGVGTEVLAYTNAKCEGESGLASISNFMQGHFTSRGMPPRIAESIPAVEAYVPAGQTFYGRFSRTWPSYFQSTSCSVLFAFTPAQDADYEIDLDNFERGGKWFCRPVVKRLVKNGDGSGYDREAVPLEQFKC